MTTPVATQAAERQWRGLERHATQHRDLMRRAGCRDWMGGRGIVPNLSAYLGQRNDGFCVWCGDAVESKRQRWHSDCVVAYQVALGRQRNMANNPLISLKDGCALCGANPATDVDHIDPLALARVSGDWDRILRAHTLANLQPLCRDCHKAKTAVDVRSIAEIKAESRDKVQKPVLKPLPRQEEHQQYRLLLEEV